MERSAILLSLVLTTFMVSPVTCTTNTSPKEDPTLAPSSLVSSKSPYADDYEDVNQDMAKALVGKSRKGFDFSGVKNVTCMFPCVCEISSKGLVVNCSHGNLASVPKELPQNTTWLILSHNHIRVIHPGVFRRLVILERLDLTSNDLTRLGSKAFEGLQHLGTLLLNENPLNMSPKTFADNVFAPLSSLRYLDLRSTLISDDPGFEYPDEALSRLIALKTLAINGLSNRTFGAGVRKMVALRTLDLSRTSSFTSLSRDTFVNFKNISIINLNISYCDLVWIHREAFCNLPNIDSIDYSYNERLEIKGVGVSTFGLQNSTIRKIVMHRVHAPPSLTIIAVEDVQYLTNTKLEVLHVDRNSVGQLMGLEPILALPVSLKILTASWNNIQTDDMQVLMFLRLRNIEQADASNQEVYRGDGRISASKTAEQSINTRELELRNSTSIGTLKNKIAGKYNTWWSILREDSFSQKSSELRIFMPPKLWLLNCSRVYKIRMAIGEIQFVKSSLKYLNFAYNQLNRWQGPIKGVESLRQLDLTGNGCDTVSELFFAYMTGLEKLHIGHNMFGKNALSDMTFHNLTSLKVLHMDDVQLERVGRNLFSRLTNLTHLQLSDNYISHWESNISGLVRLQSLNLANNRMRVLPKSLCHDLDTIHRFTQIQIDLQGNPFECTCDSFHFTEWLSNTKVQIWRLNNTYCTLANGTALSLINNKAIVSYLQKSCQSYTALIGSLFACLVAFLIIVSVKIIHRRRWKIKYLIYMASNWRKRTGYHRLDNAEENQFGFDAFVSYEDSDRTFIRERIIPRLETEAGLKLCIDKRDFVPGLYVTDNILHAIQGSRKTVVLLSRKFLKSNWCMYELNMARMEEIYHDREVLVVVLTEEIPVSEMPAEILEIVHSQTYIEITNNRYGESLFWERLVSAIK